MQKLTVCHKQCIIFPEVITDPSILFSPWANMLPCDKDIKISLGLHPRLANKCSSIYLKEMEHLLSDSSVVAVGGVGLDARKVESSDNHVSIFTSFLKIAEHNTKTLRLACTGVHNICMQLPKKNLPSGHGNHTCQLY